MLIQPPNDDEPPIEESSIVIEQSEKDRIAEYLNVESWKCTSCGAMNFGRSIKCNYPKCGVPRS